MFDNETAKRILTAADCSAAAYLPFNSPAFSTWAEGYECVRPWVAGNAEAVGVIRDEVAYIAFRGTEPGKIRDWMTDLSARPEPFPRYGSNAFVHSGFESYMLALEDHIIQFIAVAANGLPVVLCGHSLGGAAAVLAAAMVSDRHALPEVITFGAPPAGSRDFCKAFTDLLGHKTYRFEHGADLVPVLPGLLPWLRHVGDRYYLPNVRKTIWRNPGQLQYRLDRLAGYVPAAIKYTNPLRIAAGIAGAMVADHGMDRYRRHLERGLHAVPVNSCL